MTSFHKIFQSSSSVFQDKEEDEASKAVESIILDKKETEILERITRTTHEAESNRNTRKRDNTHLSSDEEKKCSKNIKIQDSMAPISSQANVNQNLSGRQHQTSINNVAMNVEVHYNETSINNNSNGRNVTLDMAKITPGAPGIINSSGVTFH